MADTKATGRGSAARMHGIVRGPDDQPVPELSFVMRAANGGRRAEATSAADGTLTFHCPLAAGSEVVVYTTHERWVVDQKKDADKAGETVTKG